MKTNLLYAIRNILKNKTNSFITVVGLSIAVACCLVIYFFVQQEFGMNSFHKNLDRIYRLQYKIKYMDGDEMATYLDRDLPGIIKDNIPQIEKCAEYRHTFLKTMQFNNHYFDIDMSYAHRDFFDIFSFDVMIGDKETLFANPDEIVITRKMADKILKDDLNYESLLGKTISFPLAYGNQQFRITAILKDIPKNSNIYFEGIIPGNNGNNFGGCDNRFGRASIYYLVKEDASSADAENAVVALLNNHYSGTIQRGQQDNSIRDGEDAFVPMAVPFSEAYFTNGVSTCCERTSNRRNSVILIAIGVLILTIASSNYSILSLGQYLKKVGDVGIRRSMGATPRHIFSVFFTEGFILSFASFVFGIGLCMLFIPLFNSLSDSKIITDLINYKKAILFIAISFIVIVFVTSLVPVLVFAKISPQQISGNNLNMGKRGYLSQIFVSVQYSLSIVLIVVAVFIVRQSNFLREKSLGLTAEGIIDIKIDRVESSQRRVFAKLLKEHIGVQNVTLTARDFMNGNSSSTVNKGDGEQISVNRFKVDHAYISTLGLQIRHGNDFTEANVRQDDGKMIVNESFVEAFQIEENPIGRTYEIIGRNHTIIGVVKDYSFKDVTRRISPAMMFTSTNYGNGYYRALMRYNPERLTDVSKHMEECYKKVAPGKELTYHFWDEELGKRYKEEERWGNIVGYAAGIAILISTLGLFGLTILLVNQRIKEIGVRKVNGATSGEVLLAINKSFVIWLFGSILISAPLAYLIVQRWMESFPYKISISWWVFLVSGTVALGVAVLTVSLQSLRAAKRNPVEALRYE